MVASLVSTSDVVAVTLKRITEDEVHALRDSLENELEGAVSRAIRAWLADVRRVALRAVEHSGSSVLLAAGTDEMPGMGTIAGWWSQYVDSAIVESVRAALYRAFNRWTDQHVDSSPAEEATNTYLSRVRDRLVLGTHMGVPIYEDSFGKIRLALAVSAAEDWTRPQLAQRIAAELSWEKDGPYWRGQLEQTDAKIDAILDPLGPPGNPAREMARLSDPRVQALRNERNIAVKHLDEERSVWQTRATLIARTEATGGANFGAYQALIMEGVTTKKWLATNDTRTRLTHREADGQEVPIEGSFTVGVSLMLFPGDPSAPVGEVANCRCAMIGGVAQPELPEETRVEPQFARIDEAELERSARRMTAGNSTLPQDMGAAAWNTSKTNPDYHRGKAFQINCQRAVHAWEARMRGYNVVAKGNHAGDDFGIGSQPGGYYHVFKGLPERMEENRVTLFVKTLEARIIEEALREAGLADARWAQSPTQYVKDMTNTWPDGARGIIRFTRPDKSAHVFNVVKSSKGIYCVDAQTNKIYPLSRLPYWKEIARSTIGAMSMARVDDLEWASEELIDKAMEEGK